MNIKDITGNYTLSLKDQKYNLSITGKGAKQKGNLTLENEKIQSTFSFKNNWVSITMNNNSTFTRILGKVSYNSNEINGTAFDLSLIHI